MLPRLVVISAVIALLALAAPALAPDLIASFEPQAAIATAESEQAPGARKVAIGADDRGHFITVAAINGRTIEVVIDTGATTVALTQGTARRLGIALAAADYTVRIDTANGVVRAAPVVVAAISVGNVTIHDVAAVVVEGDTLELNLLGMSFLSRLTKFEAAGRAARPRSIVPSDSPCHDARRWL